MSYQSVAVVSSAASEASVSGVGHAQLINGHNSMLLVKGPKRCIPDQDPPATAIEHKQVDGTSDASVKWASPLVTSVYTIPALQNTGPIVAEPGDGGDAPPSPLQSVPQLVPQGSWALPATPRVVKQRMQQGTTSGSVAVAGTAPAVPRRRRRKRLGCCC
mmetsp:Transcript_94079/g.251900  ORF Transcript_94079/g.251900 Transcript_94079/m.251900 type:complete len:160 (-) Transcript_94079:220-699(-)